MLYGERSINIKNSGFSKWRPPAGQHKKEENRVFFNRSRPVRDSCPGRKKSRVRIYKKIIGYGKLPGCPDRVCLVIARFLAGGQCIRCTIGRINGLLLPKATVVYATSVFELQSLSNPVVIAGVLLPVRAKKTPVALVIP